MIDKSVKDKLCEPDTLPNFLHSFKRILEDHESKLNLKSNEAFLRSRNVLKNRAEELEKLGKGNKPNSTCSLALS